MGSLSEYHRSAGAVHSIGWHIVWRPKYRNFVASVGRVSEATIRTYIDGQTTRAEQGER
ncbi:MAG: hypothetical protein ACRDYV_02345 [Acidimicrobiia bacterium]